MVKKRRVLEIDFGDPRWADPQRRLLPCPKANRFLGFSTKTGDFIYISPCGLSKIGMIFTSSLLELSDWRTNWSRWKGSVGLEESMLVRGRVVVEDK
jgi:hypothetical protein